MSKRRSSLLELSQSNNSKISKISSHEIDQEDSKEGEINNILDSNDNSIITDLIRFILFQHSKYEYIKISHIKEHVLKSRATKTKYSILLYKAKELLLNNFGLELVELDKPSTINSLSLAVKAKEQLDAAKAQAESSQISGTQNIALQAEENNNVRWGNKTGNFMIRLAEKDINKKQLLLSSNVTEVEIIGLLSFLYSLIKLEPEGKININTLMKYLSEVQLADERKEFVKSHDTFEDVKVLIESIFVKQGYLTLLKDENDTFYAIGPRGKKEIKTSNIWDIICEIVGKSLPVIKMNELKVEDSCY